MSSAKQPALTVGPERLLKDSRGGVLRRATRGQAADLTALAGVRGPARSGRAGRPVLVHGPPHRGGLASTAAGMPIATISALWWLRVRHPASSRFRGGARSAGVRSRRGSGVPAIERSWRTRRVDDVPVWVISCFYVRKGHRRQGVTAALIDGALDFARYAGRAGGRGVSTRRRRFAECHEHRLCVDLCRRGVRRGGPAVPREADHALHIHRIVTPKRRHARTNV